MWLCDHLKKKDVCLCVKEKDLDLSEQMVNIKPHCPGLEDPGCLYLSLSDHPAAQKHSFASKALWKSSGLCLKRFHVKAFVQTHTSLYVPAKADPSDAHIEDKQLNRMWCCEWKDRQYIIYLFNAKHDECIHIRQSYWSESQSHIISISELWAHAVKSQTIRTWNNRPPENHLVRLMKESFLNTFSNTRIEHREAIWVNFEFQ